MRQAATVLSASLPALQIPLTSALEAAAATGNPAAVWSSRGAGGRAQDAKVPLADQVGELSLLQEEGKIRHIGLSEVTVAQLREAEKLATIVSVQNLFNLVARSAEPLLQYAEDANIAFIPWFPLATGGLAEPGGPLQELATRLGATGAQLALAWLHGRSPVMLPIPGTSTISHLEENLMGATVSLTDEDMDAVSAATERTPK